MVEVLDDKEYAPPRIPVRGDFPETAEDEPVPKSQHLRLNVLGLVFTMVFAADLGTSISKAPLIRGTYPQNPICPFQIYFSRHKTSFSVDLLKRYCLKFQG